ncbi:MAG TPA: hypothetical protein VK927_08235, partial [Adhaeribacter sp.]|nr:hypothetical protein [Adhaeribacter sp.]
MNKNLRSFIFVLLALGASFSIQAQPTLTLADYAPVIGEQFTAYTGNYLPQGNAGPNQTWNFSNFASNATLVTDYVSRQNAPYPTQFPAANMAGKTSVNDVTFFEVASSALRSHGVYINSQSSLTSFSNPIDFPFPYSFNTTYTDTYEGTYFASGYNFTRFGTITYTYDAYGTVITPAGTFQNVVRLKSIDIVRDSTSLGGVVPYQINAMVETYSYIVPGIHHPIAQMVTLTSGTVTKTYGLYLDAVPLGRDKDLASVVDLKVFPNPATSASTLQFKLKAPGQVKLTLVNLAGQEIAMLEHSFFSSDSQSIEIPVAS